MEEFIESQSHPQPSNVLHLYAGKFDNLGLSGVHGSIQYVRFLSVPSNGFSLAQSGVYCQGVNPEFTIETIEMGVIVNPALYGDSSVHLFTFFTTEGYDNLGDRIAGWDETVAGFVPCVNSCTETGGPAPFGPGVVLPDPGSGNQRQLRTVFSEGRWWVRDGISSGAYTWLGYYPVGNGSTNIHFDLIDNGACAAQWFGEAYDATPTTWSNENQGNGTYGSASGSLSFSGLFNEVPANLAFNPDGDTPTNDLDCYNTSPGTFTTTVAQFRYGGPGGDVSGCP